MIDHFLTLGVARQPWVDQEVLKSAFHQAAAQHHPDQPGGNAEMFTAINQAWKTLNNPVTCLRHWLELQNPAFVPSSNPPAELMDFFMEVCSYQQEVLKVRTAEPGSTAVARSLEMIRTGAVRGRRESILQKIHARSEILHAAIREQTVDLKTMEAFYLQIAFLRRWAETL